MDQLGRLDPERNDTVHDCAATVRYVKRLAAFAMP
jgi:hypothetical protein